MTCAVSSVRLVYIVRACCSLCEQLAGLLLFIIADYGD